MLNTKMYDIHLGKKSNSCILALNFCCKSNLNAIKRFKTVHLFFIRNISLFSHNKRENKYIF